MSNFICIIQARNSSIRLPYKSLKKIYDKTLIESVYDSISRSKKINKIVVATSNHVSDDAIYNLCKRNGIICKRGSRLNVANRFKKILKIYNYKYFIRVSGDSPIIDYKILDKLIDISKIEDYDILTNVQKRSFPKGQSIEILKSRVFFNNLKFILKNKYYYENVTPYFYDNHNKFNIYNLSNKNNYSKINLSIDTLKDLKFIRKIVKKNKNQFKSWYYYKNLYLKLMNEK